MGLFERIWVQFFKYMVKSCTSGVGQPLLSFTIVVLP